MIITANGRRRKIVGLQAYKEKGGKEYTLVWLRNSWINGCHVRCYDALGRLYECDPDDEVPGPLCETSVSDEYLSKCYAVSWSKLPVVWRKAFAERFDVSD